VKNNSQPEKQLENKQRRDFIKKSTIVGAGVAATAVASTSAIAGGVTADTEKPGQQGYQLTQHVLDYYKSADI
jgi:ribosomal protein S8E